MRYARLRLRFARYDKKGVTSLGMRGGIASLGWKNREILRVVRERAQKKTFRGKPWKVDFVWFVKTRND